MKVKFLDNHRLLFRFIAISSLIVTTALGGCAVDEYSSQKTSENNNNTADFNTFQERGDISFVLINNTGRTIEEFYASPTKVDNWEEDILGEYVLFDRKRSEISINDDRQNCLYDFLAVVAPSDDGTVGRGTLYQTNINICDISYYEYFNKSGLAMN